VRSWLKALGLACAFILGLAIIGTGLLNYPLVVVPLLFVAFLTVMIRYDMKE
jgi:hypothetical protein